LNVSRHRQFEKIGRSRRAVAEVEPEDVGASVEQGANGVGRRAGESERCDDLGFAIHGVCSLSATPLCSDQNRPEIIDVRQRGASDHLIPQRLEEPMPVIVGEAPVHVDSGRLGSVKRMFDMIGFRLLDHGGREVLAGQQGKRRTQ